MNKIMLLYIFPLCKNIYSTQIKNGYDSRYKNKEIVNYDTIQKIKINMQKLELLHQLENNNRSLYDKVFLINSSLFFNSNDLKSSNIKNGGLMDNFNFNFNHLHDHYIL